LEESWRLKIDTAKVKDINVKSLPGVIPKIQKNKKENQSKLIRNQDVELNFQLLHSPEIFAEAKRIKKDDHRSPSFLEYAHLWIE